MNNLTRLTLADDYRAQLMDMFPNLTAPQLMRFNELAASDRLVTDTGEPTEAMVAWVKGVAK